MPAQRLKKKAWMINPVVRLKTCLKLECYFMIMLSMKGGRFWLTRFALLRLVIIETKSLIDCASPEPILNQGPSRLTRFSKVIIGIGTKEYYWLDVN